MINVEVSANGSESTMGLIRRFTTRMREAGILGRMREVRYRARAKSGFVQKKRALSAIERREKYERLAKLGKITPRQGRRR